MSDPLHTMQPQAIRTLQRKADDDALAKSEYILLGNLEDGFLIQVAIEKDIYAVETTNGEIKKYKHLNRAIAYIIDEFNALKITVKIQ